MQRTGRPSPVQSYSATKRCHSSSRKIGLMTALHGTGPARDLVLASASPRRRDILRTLGLVFEVDAADVDESVPAGASIDAVVAALARDKGHEVASRHPGALVIAADTLVELDGVILGKPSGPDEAHQMLARMSGRRHRVATGVVLLDAATGEE